MRVSLIVLVLLSLVFAVFANKNTCGCNSGTSDRVSILILMKTLEKGNRFRSYDCLGF